MIKIENVSKQYNTKNNIVKALSDINFELPNKGFVALCGENGCGKTTLLNLISTIDDDYEGNILIDNLNIKENKKLIRSKIISYVFQDNCFINNMTVEENLLFINQDNKNYNNKLIDFKISNKKLNKTYELSGGQKQKVSFIKGIIKDYQILLVDEPTSSMDEEMEKYVFNQLKEISKEKLVLLVSHNHFLINNYCDIIIKLCNGNLESVINNIKITNVSYNENEIMFTNELNFNLIDKEKSQEMIDKYQEIKIHLQKVKKVDSYLDYSVQKKELDSNKKITSKQEKLIFKHLFLNTIKKNIIFSFILCFLILLLQMMIDFRNFDSLQFTYDIITKNEDTLMYCTQTNLEDKSKKFTSNNAEFIKKEYKCKADILKILEYSTLFIKYDQLDDSYLSDFAGFSNTIITDFNNYKFIAGNKPNTYEEAVITDYVADSYINMNSDCNSYDDILKNGIFSNENYKINVSGIIDTDYEKSLDKINSLEYNSTYYDVIDNKFSYIYQSLYLPSYKIDNANRKSLIEIKNYYVDVVLDESLVDNNVKVNQALADKLGYNDGAMNVDTYLLNELTVIGIVNDGNDNPTYYLGKELYDYVLEDKNSISTCSYLIEINSKEELKYLFDYEIEFEHGAGHKANEIVQIINQLNDFFSILFNILLIFIIGIVLILISNWIKSNKMIYFNYKLNGYNQIDYLKNEFFTLLIFIGTFALINIAFYELIYNFLNTIIKTDFFLYLFVNHFETYFKSLGIVFMIFILSYGLNVLIRNKISLIKLISKKNN